MKRLFLVFASLLLLAGCAKPIRQINSVPSGATVTFAGSDLGRTPIREVEPPYKEKCWKAGTYSVELAGYKAVREWKPGSCDDFSLNFTLEKLPMREITSTPPGAKVTFNGRAVGNTPTKEETPPEGVSCWNEGTYTLELAGYKPVTKKKEGSCSDLNLQFDLEKLTEITMEITSNPPEAKIEFYADPKKKFMSEIGTTPLKMAKDDAKTSNKPVWPKGFLRASLRGYRNQTIEVEETDKSYKRHFELVPLPKFPDPPAAYYPSPESVIITPVMLDHHKDQMLAIDPSKTLAIYVFKEPSGSGAGSLVADSLILNLRNRNYKVVDRESIDNAKKEMGMLAEREVIAEDREMISKLGKRLGADFFITGAITDYSAKSETVNISPIVAESEEKNYLKQVKDYVDYYTSEELQLPQEPKSLQNWEMDYASKPKSYYLSIARVGVTAKMVNVATSEVVWVGIANATDMRLQENVKRISNEMINDFTGTKSQLPLTKIAK